MIKQKIAILAATIAVAASITTSQAALVTGNIGFTGAVTLNGSVASATTITGWGSPTVTVDSGSFASVAPNTAVTFTTPWNFTTVAPISSFWSVGGFVFNLSSWVYLQSSLGGMEFLAVSGTGFVSGNGYSSTAASFTLGLSDPAASDTPSWTFRASTAAVPEPSTIVAGALLLLPFGISTVRILRKNKNA